MADIDSKENMLSRFGWKEPIQTDDETLFCIKFERRGALSHLVVASVTFDNDGILRQWTVYWGGCRKLDRDDATRWVARWGPVMSRVEAECFVPELPPQFYRTIIDPEDRPSWREEGESDANGMA